MQSNFQDGDIFEERLDFCIEEITYLLYDIEYITQDKAVIQFVHVNSTRKIYK